MNQLCSIKLLKKHRGIQSSEHFFEQLLSGLFFYGQSSVLYYIFLRREYSEEGINRS